MGYFEPDGERMRKVLCLRNDVRNVRCNKKHNTLLQLLQVRLIQENTLSDHPSITV